MKPEFKYYNKWFKESFEIDLETAPLIIIRVAYQNDNNKNLPPLKMIYLIPIPTYDGRRVQEISDDNFNKVKKFLIQQKVW